MELKVWVDGVQRVVCGVSEQTSCQEVVIALAQAIGQTGRYVLIQTLRDKERQLLPHERPLEFLAKCGQYANDVQFLLRRTGPSLTERPSSDSATELPERTFVRASLPIKPGQGRTELPKKALTFNLGPRDSSVFLAKPRLKQHQKNGPESLDVAVSNPHTKEDVLKMVLRQQDKLHMLGQQNDCLGVELQHWGQDGNSSLEDEILYLERQLQQNEFELGEEEFWQNELCIEKDSEQERQDKVLQLHSTMQEYTHKIQELTAKIKVLEAEIQRESSKRPKDFSSPSPAELEDMLSKMRRELEVKSSHSLQLESNLGNVERAFQEAERSLQFRNHELEELNKELRQCNLQQFILQTGATTTALQSRTEEEVQPDTEQPPPTNWKSTGSQYRSTDSSPPPTVKQLFGNPRRLQNPLLSSLTPEGWL
ncbi:ras association domain-containing protein 7 isoform X2 [Rhinatrema bivittatum]|uniref:ras association domain-containing protein 7 isoform X2 n=1 Tax=Rhinatrema bivittatum TaxID=194408 RepID=UPI001129BBF2|nr:ras association domain-containing protein 7 isoform X2 [Rhinatrema bivittatum]